MKYFVLFFLFLNLTAQDEYSFRAAYGKVTESDFGEVLTGYIQPHPYDLRVLALDGGYLLKENSFDMPIDVYLKVGLSVFDEGGNQDDVFEGTLYFKFYWNIDFLDNKARIGFGEGVSYTNSILYTEYLEALPKNGNNSKYLNYIDFSLDLDAGRLFRYKPLYETFMGFGVKHRSGVYGLINNVKKGGSNYICFYVETNF
ncbi:hypothetical protein KJ691_00785 [bacterium]|nr:hypothetical protein [bacterium]